MNVPTYIYHADWGSCPAKQWLARANRKEGRYFASAPACITDCSSLVQSILNEIGTAGSAILGFDFPIGLPAFYAQSKGIQQFKSFLALADSKEWCDFYNLATNAAEISLSRPFYPYRPGGTKRAHLTRALQVERFDDLLRECEKAREGRRAASPLFWTLGPKQVGRAAICGWRKVLAPALRDHSESVSFWPFDGSLSEIVRPGRLVILETYPADYYRLLFPGTLKSKTKRANRARVAKDIFAWSQKSSVDFDQKLVSEVWSGFVNDDAFDATVGLFGMIESVRCPPEELEPTLPAALTVEGWIFGLENHH